MTPISYRPATMVVVNHRLWGRHRPGARSWVIQRIGRLCSWKRGFVEDDKKPAGSKKRCHSVHGAASLGDTSDPAAPPSAAFHWARLWLPKAAPAQKAIVERLVRAVVRGRIAPAHAGTDHVHDAAEHAAIIDARDAVQQRKKGADPRICACESQNESSMRRTSALHGISRSIRLKALRI